MKYYQVHPEDNHDTTGFVLNTKEPFQIDFHHFSREKKRVVVIEDCTFLRGERNLPKSILENRRFGYTSTMVWSSGAYTLLQPLLEPSIKHAVSLFFDDMVFYFVIPHQYIPESVDEDGYLLMPSEQEVRDIVPPNIHFFSVEAYSPSLFATEDFKKLVEKNKLKGFYFQDAGFMGS